MRDPLLLLPFYLGRGSLPSMFTIEHEFDATVVTLVDDVAAHRQEDVTINAFEDCVTIEQLDPRTGEVGKVTLSLGQVADLKEALNLPEGVYRRLTQGRT